MSNASPSCPSTSELAAVLEGNVPESEIIRIMQHLDHCEHCVSVLDVLTGPCVSKHDNQTDFASVERTAKNSAEDDTTEHKFLDRLKSSFGFTIPAFIGNYKVIRKLGQGMMGEVFECELTGASGHYALKTIRYQIMSPEMVTRISQEARMLAALDHPNIVHLHEFGITIDGMPFLAMEFVDGGTLSERLRKSKFEPNLAASLLLKCAEALEHAHSMGVLHRDLKPSNIMLENVPSSDSDSEAPEMQIPKLGDFGLARYFEGETHVTQSGSLIGTPGYMSPEQIHAGNRLGPESDVYALGVILYETLTGSVPFKSPSLAELVRKIQDDTPLSPRSAAPGIPRDLEIICLKCLEKRPEDRYLSAHELAADLKRFLNLEPILARPQPWITQARRWGARNRLLAASLITSGFLLLALSFSSVAFGIWTSRSLKQVVEAKEEAIRNERLAIASAAKAQKAESRAVESQRESDVAKLKAQTNLIEVSRQRDIAVNLMEKSTGALYHAFMESRGSGFGDIPEIRRLRSIIAKEYSSLASESLKIGRLESDKTIFLIGLLYKSGVILWESGSQDQASIQLRELNDLYHTLSQKDRSLEGMIAQIISARMLLGESEYSNNGPDAGIAAWKRNWDEWYSKGEEWLRNHPSAAEPLMDQGRLLVEELEENEKWDDLKRIEPELKHLQKLLKELQSLRTKK